MPGAKVYSLGQPARLQAARPFRSSPEQASSQPASVLDAALNPNGPLRMLGYDIPEDEGFAIAEAIGVDAYVQLGAGLDGMAFALEDGGTLKISLRPREAAVAYQIMTGGLDPELSVFPDVRSVFRTQLSDGTPVWAIVREAIEEVFQDPSDEERAWIDAWRICADAACRGAVSGDKSHIQSATAFWGARTPDLSAFSAALSDLADTDSFRIGDLGWNNLGLTRDGQLKIRDFSGFSVRPDLHAASINAIEAAPSRSFSPK